MKHIELTINITPKQPFAEIITVQLADAGFDSFVDTETGVIAYADSSKTSVERAIEETLLGEKRSDVKINFSSKTIEQQNWNALWESNFEPIFIDNKLSIIAPFHDRSLVKGIIVEIQPQMSFGTGHHPTTYMMAETILELNKNNKTILDMGTGTGVLAIICEKLYPESKIIAIDIEENSIHNAKENIQRNNCKNITALIGDIEKIPDTTTFDLILANINKNTLKKHLHVYAQKINNTGKIAISGFFETDVTELCEIAEKYELKHQLTSVKDNWAIILFTKQTI